MSNHINLYATATHRLHIPDLVMVIIDYTVYVFGESQESILGMTHDITSYCTRSHLV